MGVTQPNIAGKITAYPLYAYTLDWISKQRGKYYEGIVSSTNLPSLNLHYRMGAYAMDVTDEYIWRKGIR